jgi:hypothetical protein
MNLQGTLCGNVDWIRPVTVHWQAFVITVVNISAALKVENFVIERLLVARKFAFWGPR